MARTVGIGIQDFGKLIENDYFYVDKTHFIKEWWEGGDDVTLITRPRRFGKTLTMSMTERFFSVKYAGKGGLFEGLSICWMNMIPPCRRPMSMVTGRNLWHLPGVCSIPPLKQTRGWNGPL